MKSILLTILFVLVYHSCSGQRIEEVKYQLSIAKHDTTRAKLLAELANLYRTNNIDSALYQAGKGVTAFKDSLSRASNIQVIQATIAREKARQKDIENVKISYQNQLRQYALFAAIGASFLLSFILYRHNRQKQKANAVLEKALTDLKTTQTQLVQKEKMASLGELMAGIAHDIQNPLNFVNNFSELSAELIGELKDEVQAGHTDDVLTLANDLTRNINKITHHGKRASGIVKGMLDHSRINTSERLPTNINSLVDEQLRLAYQGLEANVRPGSTRTERVQFACEVVTDFDPLVPELIVAPQEIGRVLLNLYNNAFYAVRQKQKLTSTDYRPTVWVRTKRTNEQVELWVRDNGTGIPENVRGKIFQPFFTTKPTGEGTGLGLSLSYDIITTGHGGGLTVNSCPGEFSEFCITLPILSLATT